MRSGIEVDRLPAWRKSGTESTQNKNNNINKMYEMNMNEKIRKRNKCENLKSRSLLRTN